jgi:hypothetical protein
MNYPAMLPDSVSERIAFEPNTGCWLWTAESSRYHQRSASNMDLNKTLRATNHRAYMAHLAALSKMNEAQLATLIAKGDLEAKEESKYRRYRPN